jgi:hypothetical protein
MMFLTGLPVDLFDQILLCFEHDHVSLCTLVKVSRVFHRATRSLIFRHIGSCTADKLSLLERSFSDDPQLRLSVHSYTVDIADCKIQDQGLEKAL